MINLQLTVGFCCSGGNLGSYGKQFCCWDSIGVRLALGEPFFTAKEARRPPLLPLSNIRWTSPWHVRGVTAGKMSLSIRGPSVAWVLLADCRILWKGAKFTPRCSGQWSLHEHPRPHKLSCVGLFWFDPVQPTIHKCPFYLTSWESSQAKSFLLPNVRSGWVPVGSLFVSTVGSLPLLR